MVTRVLVSLLAMALCARASVWSVTNDVAAVSTASVSAAAGDVRVTVAARSGGLPVDLTNMTSEWAIVDARDGEVVTNAAGRTLDATAGVVRFSAALPVGSFLATATVYPPVDPAFRVDARAITVTSALPFTVIGIAPVTNFDASAISSGTLATGRLPAVTSNLMDAATDAAYRNTASAGLTGLVASSDSAGVVVQVTPQVFSVGTTMPSRIFFYSEDSSLTNQVVIPVPSNSATRSIRVTGLFGMTNGNAGSMTLSFTLNGAAGSSTNARNHYALIYSHGSTPAGASSSNDASGAYLDDVVANSSVTGSAVSVECEIRFIHDALPRKPWSSRTAWLKADAGAAGNQAIRINSGFSTVAGSVTSITFWGSRPWTNSIWQAEHF